MKCKNRFFTRSLSLLLAFVLLFPPKASSEVAVSLTTDDGIINECNASLATFPDGVKVSSRFLELFVGRDKSDEKDKADTDEKTVLIPGGAVFGARIKQAHVTVADTGGILGIKDGDEIISIGGMEISDIDDVREFLKGYVGGEVKISFRRDGIVMNTNVTPKLTDGEYKLGLTLRDAAAGIGTITYIDPKTGDFGGLGHGICDSISGEIIEITSGTVTGVILGGVQKGASGKPGELSGILTDKTFGSVYSNTECGVFGKLNVIPKGFDGIEAEIGHRDDVHTGAACIYSTVKNGKCTKFDIEITEVNSTSHGTKSFKIKVTDSALLAITGGIVKGMSGSPIIQDGKLVGAVTHVMVADPTEGYGIFIENMLNAAEMSMAKAA